MGEKKIKDKKLKDKKKCTCFVLMLIRCGWVLWSSGKAKLGMFIVIVLQQPEDRRGLELQAGGGHHCCCH